MCLTGGTTLVSRNEQHHIRLTRWPREGRKGSSTSLSVVKFQVPAHRSGRVHGARPILTIRNGPRKNTPVTEKTNKRKAHSECSSTTGGAFYYVAQPLLRWFRLLLFVKVMLFPHTQPEETDQVPGLLLCTPSGLFSSFLWSHCSLFAWVEELPCRFVSLSLLTFAPKRLLFTCSSEEP